MRETARWDVVFCYECGTPLRVDYTYRPDPLDALCLLVDGDIEPHTCDA